MTESIVEILLVEDNPNDAKLAQIALESENLGNNLIWLKDGAEALDYLFREGEYANRNRFNQPKLVLLDLKMPKVNGLEVLERLRNDERTRELTIVVMTSSHEEPDLKRAYSLGVNSYIVKPVNFESFKSCVREIGYYWMILNKSPFDRMTNS